MNLTKDRLAYALLHGSDSAQLLSRVSTCNDIAQLLEAREALRFADVPEAIAEVLVSRVERLTGFRSTEQAVQVSAIGDGAADRFLRDAISALDARILERGDRDAEGEAKLTLTLTIAARAGQHVVTVQETGLKLPARIGAAAVIRSSPSAEGAVLVMDKPDAQPSLFSRS